MEIRLHLRQQSRNIMVYGLSMIYRVLFILIFATLLGAYLFLKVTGIVSIIILAGSLFAALYREEWVFDGSSKEIRHYFGLLWPSKMTSYPFEQIAELKAERFLKGSLPGTPAEPEIPPERKLFRMKKEFLLFKLVFKDGNTVLIDRQSIHRKEKLENECSRINNFCGFSN